MTEISIKQEVDEVLIDFESYYNYQEVKEENGILKTEVLQKLEADDDEEEVKPPLTVLVQPYDDSDNNEASERENKSSIQKDYQVTDFSSFKIKEEKILLTGREDINYESNPQISKVLDSHLKYKDLLQEDPVSPEHSGGKKINSDECQQSFSQNKMRHEITETRHAT